MTITWYYFPSLHTYQLYTFLLTSVDLKLFNPLKTWSHSIIKHTQEFDWVCLTIVWDQVLKVLCICICMYVSMYVLFCFVMLCMDVLFVYCMHIYVCIYVYVYLYVCIYMYVHLCTYIYICVHVCTGTHCYLYESYLFAL